MSDPFITLEYSRKLGESLHVDATYVASGHRYHEEDDPVDANHEIELSDLSDLDEDEGNASDDAASVDSGASLGPEVVLSDLEEDEDGGAKEVVIF